MKYDDASWHSEGDFPDDLPEEAGGTHIGMFFAWALLSGLGGEEHLEDCADALEALRARQLTPGAYLMENCDGKLIADDLNDEGDAFARAYYNLEGGEYINDYAVTLGQDAPDLYHIADTWENFDALKPVIDQRFTAWKAGRAPGT